jgi:hypothetical protein
MSDHPPEKATVLWFFPAPLISQVVEFTVEVLFN